MTTFKKTILIILTSCFFSTVFSAPTQTQYPPDDRSQLPSGLDHTYLGLGAGYTDIPYSNSNLINGFRATSFTNPSVGLNVFIGHFFNRYLAGEISLMRPIKWAYANGLTAPTSKNSIWISIFGVEARPTLPISRRVSLYGIAGLGIVSRHGFNLSNTTVIPSEDIATFLTGGGMTYALTPHWHLNLGVQYSLARPSAQQPGIFYSYVGFYYLFKKLDLPKYYTDHYMFYKNFLALGGFSTSLFNPNINKYFTVHYLPIFWAGDLHLRNGGWFQYERNIFHTHKIFSFDLGTSISNYESSINNTNFQAFSVFPEIKLYFLRTKMTDLYFMYSVAGPTYLTRDNIDGNYLGGHFSFQDLLGVGAFIGKNKNFNINLNIGHYSNGNLWPNNPGVQVPLVVAVGYAF